MWKELELLINAFYSTGLSKVVDFEKINHITIAHQSGAIEGSTVTIDESTILINENRINVDKPLRHHLIIKNHYKALQFCLERSNSQQDVNIYFLKEIDTLVNKNKRPWINFASGKSKDTKSDFRLRNTRTGSQLSENFYKVRTLRENLCNKLNVDIPNAKTVEQIYKLSFEAHYYLANIHSWFDGSGFTSRLLMNYIQSWHNKPLSLVFAEDKLEYIEALNKTKNTDNTAFICEFMCMQMIKYLESELHKFENRNKV